MSIYYVHIRMQFVHFCVKIWHSVTTVLIIFLIINWLNLVQFKNRRKSEPDWLLSHGFYGQGKSRKFSLER